MVTFVPMFASQRWADWYAECQEITEERGGDRRRLGQVESVMMERHRADSPKPPTIGEVADHFDGVSHLPAGLEDVAGYPRLLEEMRSRGWSDEDLTKLGTGNVLRAMRAMEDVARGAR